MIEILLIVFAIFVLVGAGLVGWVYFRQPRNLSEEEADRVLETSFWKETYHEAEDE